MKKLHFDICVIGCGPAGFAAAVRSYDFGNHVCIIEGGNIGGAGVMDGALTSKTMWELSSYYATAKRVDRGYRASGLSVDYKKVRDTVLQAAREKQYQILSQIETFARTKDSTRSITLIKGWGSFNKEKQVIIEKDNGTSVTVIADDYIIASGSHPRKHPTLPFDGKRIISSDQILNIKKFPKRLLIIGAGIVGCEFATIFANYGRTEVHLLDSQERVIPFEDDDVSDYVSDRLSHIGVNIHHAATLREVRDEKTHLDVILDHKDGHTIVIAVDTILISIGRVPTVKKLGLDNIGVKLNNRDMLIVDDRCKVTDNLYAAGDISGHAALANIAEMEGRYAAKAIDSEIEFPLKYDNMSTIMFFNPEISSIGLNEKACQKQNIPYKVVFYSHSLISRAIAMRETHGFFKIIVTNEENPKVLGMRAAGPQSAASIMYIATVMDHKQNLKEILKTVHPHPSITEGIQEALRTLATKAIFKPKAFPKQIKFKVWEPTT
ncbi:MAG: NAD(P)/FAD-dependent oxidoreductase [Epsilonproteobacteria bacterium]|nr:MAG: NAD(P)/FAD-dependent oxidoreductase [Campylobacterota bacterium]